MSSKDKPKDCPCCGGEAALATFKRGRSAIGSPYWRGYVKCKKCGLNTGLQTSPDKSVNIWNRRITSR